MYIVKSIRRDKKNKLKIIFEDERELVISENNYLRAGYFFPGKILDDSTYVSLLKYESEEPYRDYLRKLLSKGYYSVYQCMVRLIEKKELEPKDARRLVGDLEREGLINDREYAEVKIDILRSQGKAPEYIKKYLKFEAKIDESIITECEDLINDIDLDIQELILNGLFKKYDKYAIGYRKSKVKSYLVKKGYEFDEAEKIVNEYINSHTESVDVGYDEKKADEFVQKYLKKYAALYGRLKRSKVEEGLLLQGYKSSEISTILVPYANEFVESEKEEVEDDFYKVYEKYIKGRGYNKAKRRKIYLRELRKLGHSIRDIIDLIEEKNDECR